MLLKAWVAPYKGLIWARTLAYNENSTITMRWIFHLFDAVVHYVPHDPSFSRNPGYVQSVQLCY
jgi:hypothetical protein